jgi:two-component system response regulator FixJ
MMDWAKQHIFLVDDEPQVLKIVGDTLAELGCKVRCFAAAADCLGHLATRKCDLLVTDVKMAKMDGIELLIEARRIVPSLPVLVITGYGDIPTAVKAMKAGASDFIEKPLQRESFLSAVESALDQSAWVEELADLELTEVELKVLPLILSGKSNKKIAQLLYRSVRTVEDHRSHIMRKFGVDNLIQLFRRAAKLGLVDFLPKE